MEFLAKDITAITGVKRTRLEQWIERDYIVPFIQKAEGAGTRNIWSRNDLYNISIFKKLTESGFSRKVIADFLSQGILANNLSDSKLSKVAFILFMRKGDKIKSAAIYGGLRIDFEYMIDELKMKGFDDAYVLNFAKIKKDIDVKIEELKQKQ